MKLSLILFFLLLAACREPEPVPKQQIDLSAALILLDKAKDLLYPLALIGVSLDSSITDSTQLYCTPSQVCLTAGDAREAANLWR